MITGWIAGEEGPCGPDTEMFYDTGKPKCSENCNPSCGCDKYVEIWITYLWNSSRQKMENTQK